MARLWRKHGLRHNAMKNKTLHKSFEKYRYFTLSDYCNLGHDNHAAKFLSIMLVKKGYLTKKMKHYFT